MTKYVGAAHANENRNVTGGRAGDQTGCEVSVTTLAASGSWSYILRPPHSAAKIAQLMTDACNNNHIGYSQELDEDDSSRLGLYYRAKANGWNIAAVNTNTDCDCSSLVALICIACGFNVSKYMTTYNEREQLKNAGFTEIPFSETTLQAGDVLWRSVHTGICTSGTGVAANSTNSNYTLGLWVTTVNELNVRTGAGTKYPIKPKNQLTADGQAHSNVKGQLYAGTKVTVTEFKKDDDNNMWGKIPSGWICLCWRGSMYAKKC